MFNAPRPRTAQQHDSGALQILRYEDTARDGIPPRRTATAYGVQGDPPTTPHSTTSAALSIAPGSPKRPRISPHPRSGTASHLYDDIKRDSGIAPSVSTSRASYAESQRSATAGGAARSPTLPTIVVQDEEPAEGIERSRSPLYKRKVNPRPNTARSASPPRHQRLRSFHGIDAHIPTDSLDDLNLQDLASDKLCFSNRGSLMFGGKKMNQLLNEKSDGPPQVNGETPAGPVVEDPVPETPLETEAPQENEAPQEPATGLVSGRRKPSVHMLQAALDSGRVLSAEENTFSMKVRTMYYYGDERAAEWTVGPGDAVSQPGTMTPDHFAHESRTPEAMANGISINKTRDQGDPGVLQPPTDQVRASYYSKQAKELAGGVEDWENVDGIEVDRYGFINTRLRTARTSVSSSARPIEPLQRVATSLRIETERPRKDRTLRRKPSVARSAQSVPPRPSSDWTIRKGPSSLHNVAVGSSKSNPFRSRDRRILEEAADMLTLPPGLEDISEQDDAGRTASLLKQREWAREEKWQKMAIPMRSTSNSKGGGMRFQFDTTNAKLIERTWKGIPDRWRATAWHSFLSASAIRRGSPATDEQLIAQYHALQEQSCADDVQIDVDVPRTVSMHIMFRRRYRGGQRLLFRVLHAVSVYFPDTGYVQGMASLAATFLCYFDEEHAFVMMVRLWQLRGLEELFRDGFEGLLTALREFETSWLGGGDVARQLEELGISSTAYGTRWYLTLFNMSIPFPAQLRVWDVFLLLGDAPSRAPGAFGGADLDVLHATSAALIDATREIVLESDFENAMKVLTSFIPIRDEDLLMRVARAEWKMSKKRAGVRV